MFRWCPRIWTWGQLDFPLRFLSFLLLSSCWSCKVFCKSANNPLIFPENVDVVGSIFPVLGKWCSGCSCTKDNEQINADCLLGCNQKGNSHRQGPQPRLQGLRIQYENGFLSLFHLLLGGNLSGFLLKLNDLQLNVLTLFPNPLLILVA